jgi:predicted metal-dependent hydrolase
MQASLTIVIQPPVPSAIKGCPEVRAWARRIGVEPREVHLRPMKRKWASCSTNGRLTFNTNLLGEPAPFRAEVIVHELLHLRIPNHGKVFRALLRAHLAEPTDQTG